MAMQWSIRTHDSQIIQAIERTANVSPVVAQILALRGLTNNDQITSFLDLKMTGLRPPQALPGVSQAVDVIDRAIKNQKKIFIYGDYDADGMTSTAILFRCLQLLDADVSYFVPNRLNDGYGLSIENLGKLQSRGAELIISVDCGIASVDEVQFARDEGMEIIVTDHHHLGPSLPPAISPKPQHVCRADGKHSQCKANLHA